MAWPRTLTLGTAGLAVAAMIVDVSPAHAAGFAIYEQSTTGLGTAFAGSAAVAEDASTIFFNPAGMVHLPGNNAVLSVSPIFPNAEFTNGTPPNDSKTFTPGEISTSGVGITDGGKPAVAGATYLSHQLSDDVWFGVGLNAPFGLVSEYDSDWVGRYNAIRSELLTFNLNTAMAFKVSNDFSIGVGVNMQFAHANLTSAIDGGLLIGQPNLRDSTIDITGNSLAFGVNAGILWEPVDGSRVGVHYRSSVNHEIRGDADLEVNPAGPPLPSSTKAGADLTLPDTLSISLLQTIVPEVDVVVDATWTNWSQFKELVVTFDSLPTSTTVTNWHNTWRVAGGLIYRHDDSWIFRAGYAYDETPVPSAEFRAPRVPDNTRHWATVGASYTIDEYFEVSAAYAHLFVEDASVDNLDPSGVHLLTGTYDSSVDIFSLQLTTSFESLGELMN